MVAIYLATALVPYILFKSFFCPVKCEDETGQLGSKDMVELVCMCRCFFWISDHLTRAYVRQLVSIV